MRNDPGASEMTDCSKGERRGGEKGRIVETGKFRISTVRWNNDASRGMESFNRLYVAQSLGATREVSQMMRTAPVFAHVMARRSHAPV